MPAPPPEALKTLTTTSVAQFKGHATSRASEGWGAATAQQSKAARKQVGSRSVGWEEAARVRKALCTWPHTHTHVHAEYSLSCVDRVWRRGAGALRASRRRQAALAKTCRQRTYGALQQHTPRACAQLTLACVVRKRGGSHTHTRASHDARNRTWSCLQACGLGDMQANKTNQPQFARRS